MQKRFLTLALFCVTFMTSLPAFAQETSRTFSVSENADKEHEKIYARWRQSGVFEMPEVFEATEPYGRAITIPEGRIYPVFFQGVPYKGEETRVFAWVGIPAGASAENPAPGIVLVHGGGGTAYREWVRTWVVRGYTAIAIDTGGAAPQYRTDGSFTAGAHTHSGPASEGGAFTRSLEPVQEQWPYHAVAAIIRAHSLLRALPETDAERTGITGISWGSVLSSIAVAADHRFRFAVLVYGCGYMGINSYRQPDVFQKLPPQTVQRWIDLWDPSGHLGSSQTPNLLFINGTNDKYFPTDSWDKSVRLAQSAPGVAVTRTLRVAMPHGHPPAGDPPEVLAYAESVVNKGAPLPAVTDSGTEADRAWVSWNKDAASAIRSVELVYTLDSGAWPERQWHTHSVPVNNGKSPHGKESDAYADTRIPPGTTAFYFNIENAAGSIASSHLQGTDAPETKSEKQ